MQKNIRIGKKEPVISGFLYSFEKDYHGMKVTELFRSLILDEINGTHTEIGQIGNVYIGNLDIKSKVYRIMYNEKDEQIISWIEKQNNLTDAVKCLLNSRIQFTDGNTIKFDIDGLNQLRKYETERKTTSQKTNLANKNNLGYKKYAEEKEALYEADKGYTEEIGKIENNIEENSSELIKNYEAEQKGISTKQENTASDNPILSYYDSMAKGGFK